MTFSTCTEGLAEAYNKNRTLTPIPTTIPSSNLKKRHVKNVTAAGIRSVSENNLKKYMK